MRGRPGQTAVKPARAAGRPRRLRAGLWCAVLLGWLAVQAPAARGAGSATLDVYSDPPGAFVSVNGRHYGVTPLRGVELEPGKYLITAALTGYDSKTTTVTVRAGAQDVFVIELEPKWSCRTVAVWLCFFFER